MGLGKVKGSTSPKCLEDHLTRPCYKCLQCQRCKIDLVSHISPGIKPAKQSYFTEDLLWLAKPSMIVSLVMSFKAFAAHLSVAAIYGFVA